MDRLFFTFVIFTVSINLSSAQENTIKNLDLGDFTSQEIHGDTSHIYRVFLHKNTFMFAIVQQIGVDLQIEILNPENQVLQYSNHQSALFGPEQISFTSNKSGACYIRISTVTKPALGKYNLILVKKKRAAVTKSQSIDELFAFYDRQGHPGASVCVMQNGKMVHLANYGMANLAHNRSIEDNTRFHIGSETKQFVAFAIATLIHNSKINPEDDIRVYLPEIPWLGDTIRIKHLLNHTSGIREFYDDLSVIAGWKKGFDLIEVMQYQRSLNFKPGDNYSYCNTGYGLLQEIFERVEQEKLSVWLQQNVFSKLGMANTFFYENKNVPDIATGYFIDDSGDFAENTDLPDGIISTSEDLSKWIMNFENQIAGNKSIFCLMAKPDTLNNGDNNTYAFGQEKIIKDGITFWGHGGGFQGYKSYILRCPEKHFGVVVLSNFDYFNNWFMARKITDIYLGIDLTEETKSKESSNPIKTVPDSMGKYCGKYWFNSDLSIDIQFQDTNLYAQVKGQPKFKIRLHDDGKFHYEKIDASIEFITSDNGTIEHLVVYQNNDKYEAFNQCPEVFSTEELEKYVGKYYCSEIESVYTITKSDAGFLMAKHPVNETINLYHFRRHQFNGDKWFFKQVEFTFDKNGITGFKLSTDRVKNLFFKKM